MEYPSSDNLMAISRYISEHNSAGTFAVGGMNEVYVNELARNLELPIMYVYRNNNYAPGKIVHYEGGIYNDGDIDICFGYNFPKFYSRIAPKGCRFNFDYFCSSQMIARLLDSNASFKQYCVILLDESMLGRQFTTESGEKIVFFSQDSEGANEIFGGLQVVIETLDNKAIVGDGQIRTITTSLKLSKIEDSQFSYNYQHIFYKDIECIFERAQALHLTRILMEKTGQAIKNAELRLELSRCSQPVHISAKEINDATRNSKCLSSRLSTMKSQANKAIRRAVVESGAPGKVNTLDFIISMGHNKGYRFNNHGY